ncbi:RNA-guided endonuclease InsQ/TnpB family protein [Nocardiopsis sp. LOL_012]|uniref:RNA-guided endonuclease InsQ/TnpB family protein n=1 Tax=Nocardiopsis sp. LOL_012 TaxID=3345409 RepID=UPI003A840489
MQRRYSFRVYPDADQRQALARAFGCARVVYNDALRARETARAEGEAFPKTGELSKKLITDAKRTPERQWLGEVSAVVPQQSLRDADTAYRAFFDGLQGKRLRTGPPRFKPRKDGRQSVRFTANARWKITGQGQLSLPKIGEVKVAWSRPLPSPPSSVTVVKDAAGRYFASFVVETDDEPLPETTDDVGIWGTSPSCGTARGSTTPGSCAAPGRS